MKKGANFAELKKEDVTLYCEATIANVWEVNDYTHVYLITFSIVLFVLNSSYYNYCHQCI